MRTGVQGAAWLTLACGLGACFQLAGFGGIEPTGPSGTGGAGGDAAAGGSLGGGGAATGCSAGYSFLPEAPDNWEGPAVVFFEPGEQPEVDCSATTYPNAVTAYTNIGGEPAECDCACAIVSLAPELSCSVTVTLYESTNLMCDLNGTAMTLFHATCDVLAGAGGAAAETRAVGNSPSTGVQCQAERLGDDMVPPESRDELRICTDATAAGSCDDAKQCYPDPPEGASWGACIFSVTERGGCPEDSEYSVRHTDIFDGTEDTRDCHCACTGEPSCSGEVELYGSAGCTNAVLDTVPVDECKALGTAQAAIYTATVLDTTCGPASVPEGEVAGTGEIIVCCTR